MEMTKRKVTKIVVREVPTSEEVFDLTLSREEVDFLQALMRNVGGCPRYSRRRIADDIARAICSVVGLGAGSAGRRDMRGTVGCADGGISL